MKGSSKVTGGAQALVAYRRAQHALADLKSAVILVLAGAGEEGLANAQIGRLLGIYAGHEGHEGHISRTMLALLQIEGVVEQDTSTKRWRIRSHKNLEPASL